MSTGLVTSPMKQITNLSSIPRSSPQKRAKTSDIFGSSIEQKNSSSIHQQQHHHHHHHNNGHESILPKLRFAKMSEHAIAPTKGSKLAAGYDLYSAYDCLVPARGKSLIKTDIQIELPSGCYGRIAPRSGLAHKHFLDVGAGVIDEDYRGNVGVILFNFNTEDYKVNKGDRIAQLVCERIYYPEIEEVENLTDTERGAGGYGSTGKN